MFALLMSSEDRAVKLLMLVVVFALLITFPILSIADRKELVWGFPKLYLYLFGVWIVFIALIFHISKKIKP